MKLALVSALTVPTTNVLADLSEGQAAVVGIAIGAALANNDRLNIQVQPQVYIGNPRVYVTPHNMYRSTPQPFVYGSIPDTRNMYPRGHSITYQTPSSTITIIEQR